MTNQRTILTALKYYSNNYPPIENPFMRTTSELDDKVNPSRNSQKLFNMFCYLQ